MSDRKKNIRPRMDAKDYALWEEFKAMYPERFEEDGSIDKKHFGTVGRHLVLGCMHVPFHNKRFLASLMSLLQDQDFVGLHIIGDFMDLNTFSSHDKGKFPAIKGLTYNQEIKESNHVLDLLQASNEFSDLSYVWGNHEDRYHRYMKDMENAKRPLMSPTDALKLRERGFSVHENWSRDFVKLGSHLELMHGTYFNVHCAKKHLDTLRGSVMFAHTHRIQHYIEGSMGAYNIGFGGDIESPAFGYATRPQRSQWQNGAAVVMLDAAGNYFVEQLTFINNHFSYGGKLY